MDQQLCGPPKLKVLSPVCGVCRLGFVAPGAAHVCFFLSPPHCKQAKDAYELAKVRLRLYNEHHCFCGGAAVRVFYL